MSDATADIAEPENEEGAEAKKPSKMPLILGVVLALVGGGGGFMAVKMGLIFGHPPAEEGVHGEAMDGHGDPLEAPPEALPEVGYVDLEPVVVSLKRTAGSAYLKFRASLEVEKTYVAEVESVRPRVMDVLNEYLRAVDVASMTDPSALPRLRAQMLRRIQIVTGRGRVRDLLILEFVLS